MFVKLHTVAFCGIGFEFRINILGVADNSFQVWYSYDGNDITI